MKWGRSTAWGALLALVLIIPNAAGAAPGPAPEGAAVLRASQVLPKSLRSGVGFKVDDKVSNDGFLNYYQVKSDYGEFRPVSTPALGKLVHEFAAIREMAKIKEDETFGKSVQDSAKKTGQGIKKLFTDPQGTFEGAAEGLGRLFDRTGEALSGPGPGQAEDSRTKQLIGFSKAKREVAAKFGVDVYSANPVLQKELERIAWADYAGGITLGVASTAVSGGAGLVLSTSGGARLLEDVMRTTPPSELRMQNRAKLQAAAISPQLIDLFIGNQIYSPREQTVITAAVEALKGVKNRDLLIQTTLRAHNRDLSFVLTNMAMLYAAYHKKVAPLTELKPLAKVFYARNKKGGTVLALPADYLTWSRRVQEGSEILAGQVKGGALELYITGKFEPRAEKELSQRGWKLTAGVSLPGVSGGAGAAKAGSR